MKGCPFHRSRRPDTENFCGQCGTEMVPVILPKCGKCGAETVNLCCVNCGTPRDEATKAIAAKNLEFIKERRMPSGLARPVRPAKMATGNVTIGPAAERKAE